MSETLSDLQYEKSGVTPQNIITELTEQLNKNNIRALSFAYVDADGYVNVRNWSKGDLDTADARVNSTMLITACDYAKLSAQGVLFGDMLGDE